MDRLIDYEGKKDEELVPLVLENGDYYLCLMERYEKKLLFYIRRITGASLEDAEDILQDVFIKAYTNLNDFDTDLKFSSWIYRIAHNQAISNFRKTKARPQTASVEDNKEMLDRLVSDSDIAAEIDWQYARSNINKILEELDDKYRQVLVLKFLEEKDYQEIADILEKPLGTVATLINRAKKRFREKALANDIKF